MKLHKIYNKSLELPVFIISDFEIELNNKIWVRTNRVYNLLTCYNVVLNGNYSKMKPHNFKLDLSESIIYELEFEKLEDLLELVPEEFL